MISNETKSVCLARRKVDFRSDLKAIQKLYRTAFPKIERFPWMLLRFLACKNDIEFICYYEEDILCGFTYTAKNENGLYVLFLAVNTEIRGRGYGSAILSNLKEYGNGRQILLNIEPPDAEAENAEERVRRYRFYRKNGFEDTGYLHTDKSGTFMILSDRSRFEEDAYLQLVKKLSKGLGEVRLTSSGIG